MDTRLFAVAADTEDGLAELLRTHLDRVRARAGLPALAWYWHDAVVRTAGAGHRLTFVVDSYADLAEQLAAALAGETDRIPPDVTARRPGLVFVFAGQGAQWYGMGRELLAAEPAFREALLRCDQEVRRFAEFSVVEQLGLDPPASRMDEIDVLQPTMVSLQIALTALWRSWGIVPDAVVGHSMGGDRGRAYRRRAGPPRCDNDRLPAQCAAAPDLR